MCCREWQCARSQCLERLCALLHGRQQLGMLAGLDGQRTVGHGRLGKHHHVDMLLITGSSRMTHDLVVVIRRGLSAHAADNSQLFHRRLLGDARTVARIMPAPARCKPGGRRAHLLVIRLEQLKVTQLGVPHAQPAVKDKIALHKRGSAALPSLARRCAFARSSGSLTYLSTTPMGTTIHRASSCAVTNSGSNGRL